MKTKVFIFGLDNAGKTALTTYLKDGASPQDLMPTKTFNIEDLILDDLEYVFWDAPGQIKLRKNWSRGIPGTRILLFVVDTSDIERFEEAKTELHNVIEDLDTRSLPLIVLFHKIDLEKSKEYVNKAREVLKIPLIMERDVFPLQTSVIDGTGIDELKKKLVEIVEKDRW